MAGKFQFDNIISARADVITEFIEASIHSILYVRGVYPAGDIILMI